MSIPTPSDGMGAIDPIQYGRLLASVEHLEKQQAEMKKTMDAMSSSIADLLELANKSKGGLWAGMGIATGLSSLATWGITQLMGGKP